MICYLLLNINYCSINKIAFDLKMLDDQGCCDLSFHSVLVVKIWTSNELTRKLEILLLKGLSTILLSRNLHV